jgi:gas vesicle protein
VTENRGSLLVPAIAGGVIGSVITAAGLLLAAPQLISGKIVRQAMLQDPQILVDAANVLQDRQYAPTLNNARAQIETPFASSWKGAQKPEVVLVEFYDYACAYW